MRTLAASILIACVLSTGCGGSSHPSTSTAPQVQGPSAQTVQGWANHWCQLNPGMTSSEVRTIMGAPTRQRTGNAGAPTQVSYRGLDYGFTVSFNSAGTVSQLVADPARLTPAERAQIHCPLTRGTATPATSTSASGPQGSSGGSNGGNCGTIPFSPIGQGARLAVSGTGMSCAEIRAIAARFVSSQVPNQALLPPGWSIKDCTGGELGGGGAFPSCKHGNQSFSLRVARGG